MAHQECNDIWEWQEEVGHNLHTWADKYWRQCQDEDCNWWELCLNKVFCWVAHAVVEAIVWIIDVPAGWFLHTICKVVLDLVDFMVTVVKGVVSVLKGIWDTAVGFAKGILTEDWSQFRDGLGEMADGVLTIVGGWIGVVRNLISVALGGDTIAWIRDRMSDSRLRDHVRGLLDSKYADSPDLKDSIATHINLDGGPFGLPLTARAIRVFVESDFRSDSSRAPDLARWHEDPSVALDLRELGGFDGSFLDRARPELVSDSGSYGSSDLDGYMASHGAQGTAFKIYSMSPSTMETKLDAAVDKATRLGLRLSWQTEEMQITDSGHVHLDDSKDSTVPEFLVSKLSRRCVNLIGSTSPPKDAFVCKSPNRLGATEDLCTIVAVAVFPYKNRDRNGVAAALFDSPCLGGTGVSGVSFRDRVPDFVFKYVTIHEIGHYFGLCHTDGLDRIMFTADPQQKKDKLTWSTLPQYLYLDGEPRFVLDEAKQVWDYIVANFPPMCLMGNE